MTDDSPREAHTPRRRFLQAVAGGTAALAAGLTARDLLAQGGTVYPPPQGGWDMAWVQRVERAKHRFVFDSPGDGGGALGNAYNVLHGYDEVYKSPDADFGAVIVFRAAGILTALNDDMWKRLKAGEKAKVKDPVTKEDALRNPYINFQAGDGSLDVTADRALDTMIARGVIVLACNLALMRQAGALAKAENMPVESARTAIAAALVPGVTRMPSGVFAVMRAQEAGCHFLKST